MAERIQSSDINIKIRLLKEGDKPVIQSFSCGDEDYCQCLNHFFHEEVFLCSKYAYVSSYCCIDKSNGEIIALFTLSNDSIALSSLTAKEEFIEEVASMGIEEEYEDVFRLQTSFPAINIGHLAVRKDLRGYGVGCKVIAFVLNTFSGTIPAGCQFITVDALNNPDTNAFYVRNGFMYQTLNDAASCTRRMYLPINILTGFED